MTKHSELPWKVVDNDSVENTKGETVAVCVGCSELSEANAAFIVRCVNNNEKLVEACKSAVVVFSDIRNRHIGNIFHSTIVKSDAEEVINFLQQAIQSAEEGNENT